MGDQYGSLVPSNPSSGRLAIALGDPAGIGAEVTLKALADPRCSRFDVLLVGNRRWLECRYTSLRARGCQTLRDPAELEILDLPLEEAVQAGISTAAAGHASFTWLTAATDLVRRGRCRALVTAPIAKAAWHAAGHPYPGQTERLAELCGVGEASMLFTALAPHGRWRLNTLLATTHIPLAEVSTRLNPALVQRKLDALLGFCRRFSGRPHLVVAGLNPHAGEGGALGSEECAWLEATLTAWRQRHPEVKLEGPLAADTCWLPAAAAWQQPGQAADGYLALYHDQGLIPVKLLAFDAAVNTTLGLPFLRTSPDHGTGFGIAGQGIARAASMVAALETAWQLG
ncbi:MAG: 4-hydroxythreonine-4-phosphate dehydrogenase PdxA [Synechococcaceae cyanobacterium]|nr:4-hydroxythreonine-4-phosphate dehydrogenase PdxA [Synechococcaceae cyanobacterium]